MWRYHRRMAICPICGAEVKGRASNKAHPFCSARCKSIDLGKWLNEEYRVPTQEEAAIEDDLPPKPDMRH